MRRLRSALPVEFLGAEASESLRAAKGFGNHADSLLPFRNGRTETERRTVVGGRDQGDIWFSSVSGDIERCEQRVDAPVSSFPG